ncbi:hypothetical protein D3C84_696930 [compost metagenome]
MKAGNKLKTIIGINFKPLRELTACSKNEKASFIFHVLSVQIEISLAQNLFAEMRNVLPDGP